MARPRISADAVKNAPTHTHVWDSWADFIAYAAQPSQWKMAEPSSTHGTYSFTQTHTKEEAVNLALYGWPAGRDNLSDTLAIVNPERGVYRASGRDVAGDFPNVPMAIAGDPMCMTTTRRSHVASHPVIRIDYNISTSGTVDANCYVNRGAALLSIVDMLEARGYSCELRLFVKAYSDHKRLNMAVTYKRAGDALDLDRAAFAITHPSVLRRFYFSVCEQHPDLEKEFDVGYGVPDRTPWDNDPYSIFVPGPTNEDDMTANNSRASISRLFNEYLENN